MTYARNVFVVALLLSATTTLGAQQPQVLTLKQAIEMAQQHGAQGRAAESNREAARDRDHAFSAGFLPSLSLFGHHAELFPLDRRRDPAGRLDAVPAAAGN